MNFEIRFTPESGITYTSVVTQLNEKWGEKVVMQFEAKVEKCIKTISSNPYLYAVVHEDMQLENAYYTKTALFFTGLMTR